MKLLTALVLVLPFVLGAPVPTNGEATTPSLPAVAPEDGSSSTKPTEALAKKGVFRAGDKVYPSKEALTEALKKKNAQPQDGQYAYYDYYGYPQPGAYPAYDYNYYAQDPYAADYTAYYKAQKEQAEYEQALKEYEYKKYLYDTDQTYLRPDLFPESQQTAPRQEVVEPQIVQVEKVDRERGEARPQVKPLSQFNSKPAKPALHEQAYKPSLYYADEEDIEEPEQVNFHRQPERERERELVYNSNSNYPSAAHASEDRDRKFQAQPQSQQKIEQTEFIPKPKKPAGRPRLDDEQQPRNTQHIKQNEDSSSPTHPKKIEHADVYPDTDSSWLKPYYRSPQAQAQAQTQAQPQPPQPPYPSPKELENTLVPARIPEPRERERISTAPRIAPPVQSQTQIQSGPRSPQQHPRPKPEVFTNHNLYPSALPPSPAPPYQPREREQHHQQQHRSTPEEQQPQQRLHQSQVYPRETTSTAWKSPVQPDEKNGEKTGGVGGPGAGNANANFVIFNRDTLGKRILGGRGYLEDKGADWVVPVEN